MIPITSPKTIPRWFGPSRAKRGWPATRPWQPMTEFRAETERLILRDWREEDWAPFFRHTNTPAVMRWLGGLLDEEGQAKMRERLPLVAQDHGHCFWVVERKADGGYLAG